MYAFLGVGVSTFAWRWCCRHVSVTFFANVNVRTFDLVKHAEARNEDTHRRILGFLNFVRAHGYKNITIPLKHSKTCQFLTGYLLSCTNCRNHRPCLTTYHNLDWMHNALIAHSLWKGIGNFQNIPCKYVCMEASSGMSRWCRGGAISWPYVHPFFEKSVALLNPAFGPSGVCALPLAAGRNEGGHYWSEQSACAALGCWHKRRWPLF